MTAAPDFFATPATVGTPAARILVVDDEPITSTMCAKALEQVGYSVTATTDVTTALSFLHSGNPLDLLLTDIQMPGMSGIDLARTAREIDPALAVIIMTGHANETTLRAAARSGVADFLSKPFELEELRIAVDQALHKRELQQEQIRLRAYEQLLASSSAINGILDDEQLSHVIVQRARIHVPCAAGFLLSYGPDQTLRVVAHAPPEADLLTAGHTMANVVAQQGGRAVTAPEPLAQLPDLPLHHGLAVPLTVQGRPLGALLLCADHPGLLSVVNQEIVTLLANQSGTALQNARLYGDMQRGYHSLAELDRLKSEFIAITSHELRSPLAIVLGYTKMVRDLSSGDQRDYAQRVLESAQQIRTIVEQLSDLRDYDRNRADLVFTPQALHPLLHIVVERLRPAAALKGQQITMHMPPDDLIIHADHEKLLLILGNLLDNAIKFGSDQGQITMTIERWTSTQLATTTKAVAHNLSMRRLTRPHPPAWAVITIRDDGIGIAREDHARIFERFYQVAASLTRKHGGTGLGLALVIDLVRLHDGIVWVESEPDHGSAFFVALPAAHAEG